MLNATEIAKAAESLHQAEQDRKQMGLLSLKHPDMTVEDAYAIQAALVRRKRDDGHRIIGWKIGLTSNAMQQALGIDTPDSGVLFDNMLFDDGASIPANRFIQPRVEAEIAFVMKAGLKGPRVNIVQVLNATDYVMPALEILDSRIVRTDPKTKKARTLVDAISDNAANGGLILGGRAVRPDRVDMRWMGAIVSRNAVIEETGLAAGVLNHPARGIAWLANRLAQCGDAIEPGQIVLSGSFIRTLEAKSGDTIVADFGAYGSVSCHFA